MWNMKKTTKKMGYLEKYQCQVQHWCICPTFPHSNLITLFYLPK